jgi:hypothetical protein
MNTQQMRLVECSPCGECGAWVVLRVPVYDTELELYEFTCLRCGAATGAAEKRIWRVPQKVEQSGHFTLDEYDQFGERYNAVGERYKTVAG